MVRVLSIAALSSLAFASDANAAEHTIKIVSLANTNDEDYAGAMAFKEHVEAATDGAIDVRVFPGGQLCGSPMECLLGLEGGVMEVFMSTLGGLANIFPELQVLDLPYLFDNDAIVEAVYGGPFVDELRAAILERTNMRLMTIGNTGGWRNIANTKREIHSPEDLRGLKLRTINSPIQIQLTRALGASPTPVPWPELYTSLATGVVDGSKNGLTDIVGMRFHEHIKFVTMDRHAYMSALWFMNNHAYLALSEAQRAVVDEGFDILRRVTMAVPKEREAAAIAEFESEGGTIYEPTPEEKAAFVAAAEPLRDWYVERYGDEWLVRIERAIAAAESEPSDG